MLLNAQFGKIAVAAAAAAAVAAVKLITEVPCQDRATNRSISGLNLIASFE